MKMCTGCKENAWSNEVSVRLSGGCRTRRSRVLTTPAWPTAAMRPRPEPSIYLLVDAFYRYIRGMMSAWNVSGARGRWVKCPRVVGRAATARLGVGRLRVVSAGESLTI